MNRVEHTILLIFQISPSWDLVLCSNHKKKTSSALDFKSRVRTNALTLAQHPTRKGSKCFTVNPRSAHFGNRVNLITSCYHIFCEYYNYIVIMKACKYFRRLITSKWAMNVSALHKRKALFITHENKWFLRTRLSQTNCIHWVGEILVFTWYNCVWEGSKSVFLNRTEYH